ncbi:MAG: nucleotide exchange factor GrpE [Thermodesulfobacteriota bacterium]
MKIPVTDEPNHPAPELTSQPEQPEESLPAVEEVPQTPEDHIEETPDPLQEARDEAARNRDLWMRAVADLENYKKRVVQERSALLKYKHEDLLRDLLPVKDNLERALNHCQEHAATEAILEGVKMIAKMLGDVLQTRGVTEIQALGGTFDPHLHDAIGRMPAEDHPPNTVVQEMEKGYLYHDRLLRPSKVVVSAAAARPEDETRHDE